jgi:perosamine synthetase
VDIFGYPAALPELCALAESKGLGVLEDACEAPGAVDADGTKLGARGHLATFAFYANKQLTTGEGGLIVPRSADEAAELRSARNQGRAINMDWLDHDRLGFNYRMTDFQAALGIAQLEKADDLLSARSRVATAYAERLASIGGAPAGDGDADGLVLPCADRGEERRSWFVYTVRVPKGHDREAVVAGLAQRGIQSKAYLPCIHLMPHYRERFGFEGGEFPVAEDVAERSLALPFFPAMSDEQVETVCEALAEALGAQDWS